MRAALTYRLGEIELFSVVFAGVANRQHMTTLKPYTGFPDPDAELHSPPPFVFFPNYPIAFTPQRRLTSGRWIAYTPYTFNNYYVDLERVGSFEEYLKSFSAKTRSTLKRKLAKFAQAEGGDIRWREYARPEEIDELIRLARDVSAKTYQERLLGTGLPASPEFGARAKERAAAGGIRGYILFLKDEPVAYVFCFCAGGVVTYDFVGYDPAHHALSPGTVLQYLILQSLFEQKEFRIFDFTEGEGPQKVLFSTDARLCAKTYFFERTLKHLFLVHLHCWLADFGEGLGKVLEKWGLKGSVRKLIRKVA